MIRSRAEWLMSRSCQSATFSSAATALPRITRARPLSLSPVIGLRLCGIAELPFWPALKYSSTSRTSVRCRWRNSVAQRSMLDAISASVVHELRVPIALNDLRGKRRRLQAELLADRSLDRRIEVRVRADRAAQLADAHARRRLLEPFQGAAEFVIHQRQLQSEGDRLGMDAVAAADHRRHLELPRPVRDGARASPSNHRPECRAASVICTASVVSSTSDDVMPWCIQRAAGPTDAATFSRKAMTS